MMYEVAILGWVVLKDLGKNEHIFKADLSSRIMKEWMFGAEFLETLSDTQERTILQSIGDFTRLSLFVSYLF